MPCSPDDLQVFASFTLRVCRDSGTGDPLPWLEQNAHLGDVIEAVLGLPVCRAIRFGEVDELEPVPSIAAARRLASIGDEVVAQYQDAEDEPDVVARFAALHGNLEAWIRVSGPTLSAHRADVVEQFITAGLAIRTRLSGVAGLDVGYVAPEAPGRPFAYARTRPPRMSRRYPGPAVVDLIDLDFHASGHPQARPDEVRTLAAHLPPPPARCDERDGALTIRWAQNSELGELARAASEHDLWICQHAVTQLAPGYNDAGDEAEARGSVEPRPPFTMYDRGEGTRSRYRRCAVPGQQGHVLESRPARPVAGDRAQVAERSCRRRGCFASTGWVDLTVIDIPRPTTQWSRVAWRKSYPSAPAPSSLADR